MQSNFTINLPFGLEADFFALDFFGDSSSQSVDQIVKKNQSTEGYDCLCILQQWKLLSHY